MLTNWDLSFNLTSDKENLETWTFDHWNKIGGRICRQSRQQDLLTTDKAFRSFFFLSFFRSFFLSLSLSLSLSFILSFYLSFLLSFFYFLINNKIIFINYTSRLPSWYSNCMSRFADTVTRMINFIMNMEQTKTFYYFSIIKTLY